MRRVHLIELSDQAWCPCAIRDVETDYLQFVVAKTRAYAVAVPILAEALQRMGNAQVLDLCSGAGGPWCWLRKELGDRGVEVRVCLTDKYPNAALPCSPGGMTPPGIRYHPQPVDATRVPDQLTGFRTLFSSFHHFRPDEARALPADAVRRHEGIAIFEGTHRSALGLSLAALVPFMVLLMTPFIRPFRWWRLFWTYLLLIVPLDCAFGYAVSCLRTYSVQELRELTAQLSAQGYQWQIGEVKGKAGPTPVTYLVGFPKDPAS
jgi:hypothetical protein